MSVGGGGKEEGWQAAGLRFRNHGNGNNGHIQKWSRRTMERGSKVEGVEGISHRLAFRGGPDIQERQERRGSLHH